MEAASRDDIGPNWYGPPVDAAPRHSPPRLIGRSEPMRALQAEIDRVARSDARVLMLGESGVGKEIAARNLHHLSSRSGMPFVPVTCAGLPEAVLEVELFGQAAGAYRAMPGKLEAAHLGTAYIDEIGELTPYLQGLLLRFLETGDIQRAGADGGSRLVNVRVVAASHRNLRDMVAKGAFREDLYYRLSVVQITVPPLRERRDDIPELVHYFLHRFGAANRSPITGVSPEAIKALAAYSWPGNVRELENMIERMVVAVTHHTIDVGDLPSEVRTQEHIAFRPRRERRRTVADDLYQRLTEQHESFWTTVYPMYMAREITRAHVRDVVRRGLEEARGNYKIVARLFNMESREYKRFLNFLRKHDCQLPFKEYR